MSNLLVDTNLLVYALDEDSRFYQRSRRLLYDSGHTLFTTSKNLSELLAVLTRGNSPAFSVSEAVTVIEEIEESFTVLYPSGDSWEILRGLLRKYQPTGLLIHDYEIISIALSHHITLIGTANEKDFSGVSEIQLAALSTSDE
jgi:predicted nucleic acid-binding protein